VPGGVIAEVFDELLGLANLVVGQAATTGTRKIRYHRPAPDLAPPDLVSCNAGSAAAPLRDHTWQQIVGQAEEQAANPEGGA
jgi:hypothetical protein